MKVYWSDRDSQSPPSHSEFLLRPFYPSKDISFVPEFVELPLPKAYKVVKRTFFPSFDAWESGVQKALELIQNKELQKVVLGRICVMELEEEPDPFAMTAALKQSKERAFVFCFQSKTESFLGASPERLFSRR